MRLNLINLNEIEIATNITSQSKILIENCTEYDKMFKDVYISLKIYTNF